MAPETDESPEEAARRAIELVRSSLEAAGREKLHSPVTAGGLQIRHVVQRSPRKREDCADLPERVANCRPSERRVYRIIRAANARGECLWPAGIVLESANGIGGELSRRTVVRALGVLRKAKMVWKVTGRGYQTYAPPNLFGAN